MHPGQSTLGPYLLLRQLAEGGMGIVYEAVHQKICRRVAIKVLNRQHAASAEVRSRLFHEAIAVNVVDHPGVVQISDYDELPDGTAFLVMEYLPGETLLARVENCNGAGSCMAVDQTLCIAWQLADALAAAHAKQVVHRDLKPENVMLVRDAAVIGGVRAKILDFGIAKLRAIETGLKTRTRMLMGTPAYMSPEQCRGAGRVDERSDCYSFGVMLYFALSGRLPFVSEGPYELIAMHLRDPAPPLVLSDGVEPELADFVMALLQKDPARRPTMTAATSLFAELLRRRGLLHAALAGVPPEPVLTTMQLPSSLSPSAPTYRAPLDAFGRPAQTERLPQQIPVGDAGGMGAATKPASFDVPLNPRIAGVENSNATPVPYTNLERPSIAGRSSSGRWLLFALACASISGIVWFSMRPRVSPGIPSDAAVGGDSQNQSIANLDTGVHVSGGADSLSIRQVPRAGGTLPIRPADDAELRQHAAVPSLTPMARQIDTSLATGAGPRGDAVAAPRPKPPGPGASDKATAVEQQEESAADIIRRQNGMPIVKSPAPVAPPVAPPVAAPAPQVPLPVTLPDDLPSLQLLSPDDLLDTERRLADAGSALEQRRCQDAMDLAAPWVNVRPAVAWLLVGEAACCLKNLQRARIAKHALRGYPAQQKTLVTRCPGL